ncbi:MAG: hypothetical protein AUK54_03650 [Helicobacteraceae bacterium CG2_30_36_10]|nr:MAG: hypothetical protein AUK54_03650 [Helicobacteraceae bacterium CG2_30_36_10]
MIKKMLISSLVAVALVLTGCGEDSGGVDKLETQQMLDNGDFNGVISRVEATASSDSDYLALAAAYMGKAGLALPDLIDIILNSDDTGDDAFVTFIDQVDTKKSSSALNDLEKSSGYYKKIVEEKCSATDANLSYSQKDICLFLGLSQTMKVATAIGYLADDISVLTADINTSDAKLTASLCAMKYAIDGRSDTNVTCSVTDNNESITFLDSNRTYSPIVISENGETFEFLITDKNSTAITSSFCSTESFSTRIALDQNITFDTLSSYSDYNASYHACPVNETLLVVGDAASEADITTADVIVSALNEGTDSIGVAASEDMQQSIDEFKCEVLGGTYNYSSCDKSLDQNVTEQQVITYLNTNNN